ncbi:hypothetical protein [uncultured Dokdonia sp.]|uniref:hypothetical protein n=1 Tax=uncultured Dokdonia sp. TaxID=575653 RepID=UPI0026088ACF|nr:hypothetical protein [uncultured Dokdonia sp.]
MKNILALFVFFAFVINTQAQQSFFEALAANGENAVYEGFGGGRSRPTIKVSIQRIAGGIPVGFTGEPVTEDWGSIGQTELSDYGRMDHYPLAMNMKHTYTNDGYVVIDNVIFAVDNIPNDGLPKFENVTVIYLLKKEGQSNQDKTKKGKKKKGGLLSKMKKKLGNTGQNSVQKYIKSVNIEQLFTDYVTAMKAKQDAYTLTSKDKMNIAAIKAARNAGDEEIKKYNDSIRKTPEYKKLKEHQARMERMESNNIVTLKNNTGSIIYVGTSGSRNRGTKINPGDTARWDCTTDGYLQSETVSGGSYNYSSTNRLVYSSNAGCGSTVSIN